MNTNIFKASPNKPLSLAKHNPTGTGSFDHKKTAKKQLKKDIERMSDLQYKLYAENRRSILIIFQAMDSAGKDSAIRHIMTGINPQGCEISSFKHPSAKELEPEQQELLEKGKQVLLEE